MGDDCVVFHNFFSEELLPRLEAVILEAGVRKMQFEFNNWSTVPKAIVDAQEFSERKLNLKFNVCILKNYKLDDSYRSGAYDFHVDPPQFHSIPLFLCTVSGEAKLEFIDSLGLSHEIKCVGNQVNVLKSSLRHRVTPPTSGFVERVFLFFGWNSELNR